MNRYLFLFALLLVACSENARHPSPAVPRLVELSVADAGTVEPATPPRVEAVVEDQEPPVVEADPVEPEPSPPPPPVKADLAVVESTENALILYREGEELVRYDVALGRGGVGKRRHGDEKTPRGRYRLLNPSSSRRFHHFILVTYPNIRDVRRGLNRGLISQAEHDELARTLGRGALPPQNTKLGGNIGIHAPEAPQGAPRPPPDPSRPPLEKTGGCIVMHEHDLEDFLQRFEPRMVIEIR